MRFYLSQSYERLVNRKSKVNKDLVRLNGVTILFTIYIVFQELPSERKDVNWIIN